MRQRPFFSPLALLLFSWLLFLAFFAHAAPEAIILPVAWYYESSQATADLGYAVNSGGDVNGDGYPDVVVGAVKYAQTTVKGGAVFLFYGGPGGLSDQPDWFFGTDMNGAELGTAVANSGDINGDGYDDLVVGAPGCSNPEPKEGCVYVFFGSASGLGSAPDQVLQLDRRDSYLGTAVDLAGDVNGDGYDDVIVGAKWFANNLTNEGAAFLFLGGPDGLSDAPVWQFEGNQARASLGTAVAGVGDVDGDGYADFLVGAPFFDGPAVDSGYAALFLGSPDGPGDTPAWEITGSHTDARLGQALAAAGDVNGDGLPDFLIGAPGWQNQDEQAIGAAFLYTGRSDCSGAEPLWTAVSDQPNSGFGAAVSGAGDMNNDGYADVVVGAWQYSGDQSKEGKIFIYLGGPGGPTAEPHWTAEGNKAETMFGFALGVGADIRQDGYADLVVGAPEFRNQTELRGRAFLYYGRDVNAPDYATFLPLVTNS
jgi:hypothetical protein